MASLQRAPAKRRFKRVLVVRHLAAQTAWLDASPLWHEGRVCWPFRLGTQTRWLPVGPAELAAAERALNKIANYPRALETAFKTETQNGSDWLSLRRLQLETVKRLARLNAPDLSILARPSYARNPATLQRLTDLLLAEALCHNSLPHSPAIILSRWPNDISATLLAFGEAEELPEPALALTFLVLGARDPNHTHHPISFAAPFARRAYQWGQANGIPSMPGIVARLLLHKGGDAFASHFLRLLPATQNLSFEIEFWSEMLAHQEVSGVLTLMQSVASCEVVTRRMTRDIIVEWPMHQNRVNPRLQKTIENLRVGQENTKTKFLQLLKEFTRDGDTELIQSLQQLALLLLELETPLSTEPEPPVVSYPSRRNLLTGALVRRQTNRHVLLVLEEVQNLSPEKRGAALRLLQENFSIIWSAESLAPLHNRHDLAKHAESRLNYVWHERGKIVLKLLQRVDEETARQAIACKVQNIIACYHWRDPALARWAIELSQNLGVDIQRPSGHLHDLCELLAAFPTLFAARSLLGPVFEALRVSDETTRPVLFFGILGHLSWCKNTRHSILRLRDYLPIITRLATPNHDDQQWSITHFANAAHMLDTKIRRAAQPQALVDTEPQSDEHKDHDFDEALTDELRIGLLPNELFEKEIADRVKEWLSWMASDILRTRPVSDAEDEKTDPIIYADLETATGLAWTLSEGDLARFQKIFSVAARHDFDDVEHFKRALDSLQTYPVARITFGYLFAGQPGRLTALWKRWGLALRLGSVQKPLDVFRDMPMMVPLTYRELLQLVPELWQEAALLAHAQSLRGQSLCLPPGLRHVLAMPLKMQSERAHLAERQQQTPRDDWAARLATLEKRLSNHAELQRVMAGEIKEKLPEIAARTMLEAIEQQVSECYRARLREVAGPLPDSLELDENWMNAILLTGDIQYNRKLLRNLLRALANGEDDWPGKHPANVKFLQDLEARNVNTKVWPNTLPRRFKGEHGTFHLRLERHPLTILQMGNYFDTCLSFGGINSFSTVANACELNKRVIFARDDKGRVVGRKLIGLNEDGKLIGFYTYTSLQDTEANQELRRCFARYCEIFAGRCGLEMAEEGTIPRLFAEQWYDDGVVKWRDEDDEEKELPGNKHECKRNRTLCQN